MQSKNYFPVLQKLLAINCETKLVATTNPHAASLRFDVVLNLRKAFEG